MSFVFRCLQKSHRQSYGFFPYRTSGCNEKSGNCKDFHGRMRHGGNSLQSVAVSVAIRCTAVQKPVNSLKTSAIYGFLHFYCPRRLEKRPSVPSFPCDFPCFSRVFFFFGKFFSSVTRWQSVVWHKVFKKTEKIFWQFVKRLYLCSRFRPKTGREGTRANRGGDESCLKRMGW